MLLTPFVLQYLQYEFWSNLNRRRLLQKFFIPGMKDVFSVKHTTTVNLHRISINACCSERNVRIVANPIKEHFLVL